MAVTLIALMLLEVILQLSWNRLYFPFGIPIFNERIRAPVDTRSPLALGSLERDVHTETWLPLIFKPLHDGSMAFRETFFISVTRRYCPIMRGLVIVENDRHEVRVVGLCNWNVLAITFSLLPVIAITPKATPMLFVLPLFFYRYWVQRGRFLGVADAIREQMANERSMESLLAKHTAAERLYRRAPRKPLASRRVKQSRRRISCCPQSVSPTRPGVTIGASFQSAGYSAGQFLPSALRPCQRGIAKNSTLTPAIAGVAARPCNGPDRSTPAH